MNRISAVRQDDGAECCAGAVLRGERLCGGCDTDARKIMEDVLQAGHGARYHDEGQL